jgi:hypothetical protein
MRPAASTRAARDDRPQDGALIGGYGTIPAPSFPTDPPFMQDRITP